MRRMSFALTTEQMRGHTKTVTRRMGWRFLKPGDLIQPVVKCMGLKKGEKHELIGGPIRVVGVRRERLDAMEFDYGEADREGFPDHTPSWFIGMFCQANVCMPHWEVTRIEFEYLEETT